MKKAAPPSERMYVCKNCLKDGTGFERCSKCKCVRYCSRECQRAHWKRSHKDVCAHLAANAITPSESRSTAPLVAVESDIETLEAALQMPLGSLQATLDAYNAGARRGEDPAFHKDPTYLRPLEHPPYGALDLRMESAHYGGFTLGGLQIDTGGHVRSVSGETIPGLFAAGRASAGVARRGYSSGLSLGDASFFGRRAGRNAALS